MTIILKDKRRIEGVTHIRFPHKGHNSGARLYFSPNTAFLLRADRVRIAEPQSEFKGSLLTELVSEIVP